MNNLNEDYGIISNPDILAESYLPPNLLCREPQIKEISFCLLPVLKGQRPIHSWLYGSPGTGKTSVARYILGKIQAETKARGIYINCCENPTYYSILKKPSCPFRAPHRGENGWNLSL
jgi:Cdc6-like AAA superfamily ATPase